MSGRCTRTITASGSLTSSRHAARSVPRRVEASRSGRGGLVIRARRTTLDLPRSLGSMRAHNIALLFCFLNGWTSLTRGQDLDLFEKRVRPILVERCYRCHGPEAEKPKGGLRLDTREGLLKGGERGPALVPGDPE